jgi:hypothetical protein
VSTAGLVLEGVDLDHPEANADLWERVIRKLRMQSMPPAGRPRPDPPVYGAFASALERSIDRSATASPNPGRPTAFHRLNRAEYRNAIRDMLALDIDVSSLLPADNTFERGFDNNGDGLSVSPELLARYLSAARKVSRLAVGIAPPGPVVETYKVHLNLLQDDRQSEDLPLGSRGGLAARHYFPVDGEYSIRIRLHRNFSDYILGFAPDARLELRLDGSRVQRFAIGGADRKGRMAPLSFAGNIAGDPVWEMYMLTGDKGLEARVPVRAGSHLVGVSFLRQMVEGEGVLQPRQRGYGLWVDERYDANAAVERVEIDGPYGVSGSGDTPSREAILVCEPTRADGDEACARRIIARLARQAYRRPVTAGEVDVLVDFFRRGRDEGGFEAGIQFALERLLVDPEFLFRVERDPPNVAAGGVYRLSDIELASRLSFFLWNSIPDATLLDLARRRQLHEGPVLEREVKRMLVDVRSRVLVDNFASQWLHLRNLESQARESADFPDFDENLRNAFQKETELFIDSTIREDHSVVDLLTANYSFLNERLARHYGIPGVYGDRFRRMTFPKNVPRGGLLGQGSLLMVTSYPNRTSPVLRGKWLLETILGAPPPEPPPNVPALPDRGEGGKPASVRERLERHRRNPVCAACHAQMDPLGFALENFDPIGSWRTTSEAGTPIDASGVMPSGVKFEGVEGLRSLLLDQRERFVETLTEKLMAYAIGRAVEYYDRPSIRAIVREAAVKDYRWSSIVVGIVQSPAFGMRRAAAAEDTHAH